MKAIAQFPLSISTREKWLAGWIVFLLLLWGLDGRYRALSEQRQSLEQQASLLRTSLQQIRQIPLPELPAPSAGDPMPLLLAPPHLRLQSLSVEKGKPTEQEVVTLVMTGKFADFKNFLHKLMETGSDWTLLEVDYRVKTHPQAEIRLRLQKPLSSS
ncbi:MAG: hypothetical protein G8345_07430 [Magnetococcales bacterium]|nr:hypothetical protein [Magnetococcales bacterium]NGZ26705.1 hypothetical protein [Magnetococcales bacterium]